MNKRYGLLAAMATAMGGLSSNALTWISHTDALGTKEYAVTDVSYTWHEAEAFAISQGGHLVAINDAAENDWLVSTFGGGELFWIGGTDEAVEGTWLWTNGDPFSYSNWNGGEPNDVSEEEWAHLNWGFPGGWNDWESGATYLNPAQGNTSFQNDSSPSRGLIERLAAGPVIPESGTWVGASALVGLIGLAIRRRATRA